AHAIGHSIQNGTAGAQNLQTIAAATTAKSVEMIARIGTS
ncbi:MAG: RebB family R body protein, partial [Myxococcales bacterium]|nr:RebB family R body protein [Myxococcales bacterium]